MSTLSDRLRHLSMTDTRADIIDRMRMAADELDRLTARVAELEDSYTADEIGQACANVGINDPMFERLLIDLQDSRAALESKHD